MDPAHRRMPAPHVSSRRPPSAGPLGAVALCGALLACGCQSAPAADGSIGFATMGRDLRSAPAALWADTEAAFTDRTNLYALGAVGGLSLLAEAFDGEEKRFFSKVGIYGDTTSSSFEKLGDGGVLLLGALGLTTFGALTDREREYVSGKVLGESLLVTGAATLAVKLLVPDTRPNNSAGDYPSGHSSMSMAAAAALDAQYGHYVGIPAYILAGLVGIQRLDSDNHDVAAVVSGWTLGFVIGHSVARRRSEVRASYSFVPMVDPERGAVGVGLSWAF
ncbi:MAG: hypothetical protein R3F49_16425 [Planctomycetota bacterium]